MDYNRALRRGLQSILFQNNLGFFQILGLMHRPFTQLKKVNTTFRGLSVDHFNWSCYTALLKKLIRKNPLALSEKKNT